MTNIDRDSSGIFVALPICANGRSGWRAFNGLADVIRTDQIDRILPSLKAVEAAVDTGLHAVGFITYEAAGGFDSALRTHPPSALPLLWFGLFRETMITRSPAALPFSVGDWKPSASRDEYRTRVARIREYLAAGASYQVNYTFRLRAAFAGDARSFFLKLYRNQSSPYAAFIDTGDFAICSVSPELFFQWEDGRLIAQPMKGTAARGLTLADDRDRIAALARSLKDRAENAMIVDMIRNDLGRIAEPGSVRVASSFDVERLPTALQMTSTVESTTSAPFHEIVRALFPCASVTGAPKVQTMKIIRELEPDPRGAYTGCVGYLAPGRRACFNVAIRTVVIDRAKNEAEYGVGGGIVWDSREADEYVECRTKARVLAADRPEFELLETILWDGANGYFLLDRHLARLRDSVEYFSFSVDMDAVEGQLVEAGKEMGHERRRVRLRVSREGEITIEAHPLGETASWHLGVAKTPIDPQDPLLYHKTTNRGVYESARHQCPNANDVLLWNPAGEATETTIGNIVIERDGKRVTPPVACGLLAGTYRNYLLDRGEISEAAITLRDVRTASQIWVVNSVRKWLPVTLLEME